MSSTETKKYSPIKAPNETEKIGEAEFSFRAKEFQKCIDDVVYFASNYYYIRSIDLGTILLPPYEAQCDLLRQIHSNRKVISLASRQSGKTTAYIAICLWICFFMEGKEIVILANKEKTAIGILKRIKRAYEWIPKEKSWIKPGVTIWNDKQIEFDNGCSITAMATSSDAARSGSAYLVIIDEAAFVKPSTMEELWASVYPVISRSATSKFVMVSTPNGIGGKFHEIWEDSTIAHNPEWTPVFIPWYKVPGRDEAWKKKEIAGFGPGGIVKFNAEYECQFLGSSPTLLDSIALKELIDCAEEARAEQPEPAEIWKIKGKGDETFDVSVWKKPKPGRAYILGGDVGEGVGLDSSIAKIFDITDLRNIEEVASYESNTIPGPIFGYIMMKMARRYNQAYVACERNGVSTSAIDALWRVYEYENIVDIGSNKAAVGIFSNWATKLDACLWLKDLMKDSEFNLILHDSKAVLEFQKFERVKAKSTVRYEASSGHDDRVMATIWAIYITKLELIEDYYEVTSRTKNCFGVEIAVRCRPDCLTSEYFETEDQLNKSLDVSERIADLKFIGNSNNANNPNAQKALPNSEDGQSEDFYDFIVNDARENEEEW
jgi:hypothetical protein